MDFSKLILSFSTIKLYLILFNVLTLFLTKYCCYKLFFFLSWSFKYFIRVSNYLDIIIPWLYQHCSTKLKYTLVIFRLVFALKSSYSILLGLSKDKCYLYLVWINILRTFWRLSTSYNFTDFVQFVMECFGPNILFFFYLFFFWFYISFSFRTMKKARDTKVTWCITWCDIIRPRMW